MDQFVVLEELGNGSFGLVFKARHKVSGDVVAIKKMKKKFTSQSRSLQEVKALEVLRSGPNIVRLHHFFLEKKELHMVFELMEGNLYQLIKDQNGLKLEESRIKSMVFQVLRGLQHMHSKGFMHRDMKPENILVNGDTVKIADLGLSRELKSRPPYTTYVSTRWYRAPEVILRSSAYSCAVDIWAAGTIAAELISLKPLFPGNSDVDQVSRIGNVLGSPASRSQVDMTNETLSSTMEGIPLRTLKEIIPNASDESLEMITGLLQYEPKSRLTAYQALHATWFKDLPEAEDLKYLTDVVQQSPDKRRSMFAGFRPSSYKKEGKEKEKEKDRKRGLSVSLPVNREKTASLTAMFLKSDAEPEPLFQQHQLHRESKVVLQQQPEHLHSGFDLPVISPISPFWSDT
ncbi:kinase-like domain-containing protein [Dissophora ornata]|nr:kinase-like domain-containing protein [Dissophora ornata]